MSEMRSTVGELKEILEDYGDQLPVVIVFSKGPNEYVVPDFDVADRNLGGEVHVVLEAEVP